MEKTKNITYTFLVSSIMEASRLANISSKLQSSSLIFWKKKWINFEIILVLDKDTER